MTAGGLIDAEPRAGKSAGIYCAPLPQGFPSLIQLTYRAQPRDALALAHELGHAMHFELAKAANPWLSVDRSLSMAVIEIPSTTAEIAALDARRARRRRGSRSCAPSSRARSTWCSRPPRCAGSSRTPPRCGPPARRSPPTAWRSCGRRGSSRTSGRRPTGRLARVAASLRRPLLQLPVHVRVPVQLPARRPAPRRPERFGGRYAAMLRAGGSLPPAGLLAMCGLDLADAALWERGLDEVERLCGEAW